MTKQIRKLAPPGATHFATMNNDVHYYKFINGQTKKYIRGFGWINSSMKEDDLHSFDMKISHVVFGAVALIIACVGIAFLSGGF